MHHKTYNPYCEALPRQKWTLADYLLTLFCIGGVLCLLAMFGYTANLAFGG